MHNLHITAVFFSLAWYMVFDKHWPLAVFDKHWPLASCQCV